MEEQFCFKAILASSSLSCTKNEAANEMIKTYAKIEPSTPDHHFVISSYFGNKENQLFFWWW